MTDHPDLSKGPFVPNVGISGVHEVQIKNHFDNKNTNEILPEENSL